VIPSVFPVANVRSIRQTGQMEYEVDVIVHRPLDVPTWEYLGTVVRAANRILRFRGEGDTTTLTVGATAATQEEAIHAAVLEVSKVYPTTQFEPIEARLAWGMGRNRTG
jgi:hypothetical protein